MGRVFLGSGEDTYEGRGRGTASGVAGPGADRLISSRADDTFVFLPGDGKDLIVDFSQSDTIDLTAFGFTGFRADLRDRIVDAGAITRIDLADFDLTIKLLAAVEPDQITLGDFII